MKTYHLRLRDDGRVILDLAQKDDKNVLQIITGDTWLDARTKVDESGLYHNPGQGWFQR